MTAMSVRCLLPIALLAGIGLPQPGAAAEPEGPGLWARTGRLRLSAPVGRYAFSSQGESLQMAFMDVTPDHPNGWTIVLLHGKNFCSATWTRRSPR